MNGLFEANGNYGNRIVISAVDQRIVISAVSYYVYLLLVELHQNVYLGWSALIPNTLLAGLILN
jgi:hypothetical protein